MNLIAVVIPSIVCYNRIVNNNDDNNNKIEKRGKTDAEHEYKRSSKKQKRETMGNSGEIGNL